MPNRQCYNKIDSNPIDLSRIEHAVKEILLAIGEDPRREGILETPARVARFWEEFIRYDPGNTDATFESITTDQMICVNNIETWSLCEHHLLPFRCNISIAYIPNEKIVGLSKFARIVHECAHRLQIQERLVDDIADRISSLAMTENVAVLGIGEHLCMQMRGVRTRAQMITSVMRGVFLSKPEARAEFIEICKNKDL